MSRQDYVETVKLFCFLKITGLKQIIEGITRPNKQGGSCIDCIITDCVFVKECGILNNFVSDHYTIYCTRKKKKEHHVRTIRTVRDYRAFDPDIFENSLVHSEWTKINGNNDPDMHWEIILKNIHNILSIMCPFKMVNTRKSVTPWLTPEIYRLIREKKCLVKKYKISRYPLLLRELPLKRNELNSKIDKAKNVYIKISLSQTITKTNKFWKLIKNLIDKDDCVDITAYTFRSTDTNEEIVKASTPDFLNNFFVNVAERMCGKFDINDHVYNE